MFITGKFNIINIGMLLDVGVEMSDETHVQCRGKNIGCLGLCGSSPWVSGGDII